MAKQALDSIGLRIRYYGAGPLIWSGGPSDFGLQDKAEVLHLGAAGSDGAVIFDLSLQVKPGETSTPVLLGPFAHGRADDRFLYLSWRNAEGNYAQRLKLPLGSITWHDVRRALSTGEPLVADLVDRNPRVTTTGANIGGSRSVTWKFL
jgi:hypothetical protein